MKTLVFIFYISLLIIFFLKREKILNYFSQKIVSLTFLIGLYFMVGTISALIYYIIDYFLLMTGKCPRLLTIYDSVFKSQGHIWDYLYFSIVSQLTLGYGDYSPRYPFSQFIAISQGLFGTFFIGAIIYYFINYSSEIKIRSIEFQVKSENIYNLKNSFLEICIYLIRNQNSNYENFSISLLAQSKHKDIKLSSKSIGFLGNNDIVCLEVDIDNEFIHSQLEYNFLKVENNHLILHEKFMVDIGTDIEDKTNEIIIEKLFLLIEYTKGDFYIS